MALNAKNAGNGGGDRVAQPNLEPGNYPARIVQIIDYGLQPQRPYQGKDKPPAQEIGITYELTDAFMVDEDGNDIEDKPRWISETFPLHNLKAENAKSTKRYNAIDPKGDADGDFSKLIGSAVMVTIINNPGKDNKVYDNVGGLSPMRPRDAANTPELVNEPLVFDLDAPDAEAFAKMPKWIQDKLKGNLNYKGSALEKIAGAPAPAEEKKADKQKVDRKAKAPVEDTDPPFDADEPADNPY